MLRCVSLSFCQFYTIGYHRIGGATVSKKTKGRGKEPNWVNPANDRVTSYTDEEIDRFVDDFILGLDDEEWIAMKSEFGERETKKRLRAGFTKMDENNLVNITPKGPVH